MLNLRKSSHHQEDVSQEELQLMDIGHSSVTVILLNLKFVCMLARSDVRLTRGCAAGCLRPIPLLICGTEDMATSVHAGNNCSQQINFAVVIGSSLTDIVLSPHLHGTGIINGHFNIARVH